MTKLRWRTRVIMALAPYIGDRVTLLLYRLVVMYPDIVAMETWMLFYAPVNRSEFDEWF